MGYYKYQRKIEREKGMRPERYNFLEEVRKLNNRIYRAELAGENVDPDLLTAILNDKKDKTLTGAAERLKGYTKKKFMSFQSEINKEEEIIIDNLKAQLSGYIDTLENEFEDFDSQYEINWYPQAEHLVDTKNALKPHKRSNRDILWDILTHAVDTYGETVVAQNISENIENINRSMSVVLYQIYVGGGHSRVELDENDDPVESGLLELEKSNAYEFERLITGDIKSVVRRIAEDDNEAI